MKRLPQLFHFLASRSEDGHSFVSTNHASLGDLRKPFDISLKGSFQLINAVIPLEKKHYVGAITEM